MAQLMIAAPLTAADMQRIRVADGGGFVLTPSNTPFVPWGFNYDHDGDGRLIEDYWHDEWERVEQDFDEMKQLGANVVRIHLQFARFMDAADQPNGASLDRLSDLLKLAERTDLYLDLTGLGCYHKQDVPAWYDALSEKDRWDAQARFWAAIAQRCAASPAIFCYDLMNEPVVAGGDKKRDDWLGPGFGDKHFVQFITLERAGRDRAEVARQWTAHLVSAIRQHDADHLITVGLVPWSLERPGLQSGFVPQRIAGELDFISVHLYPETGKVAEAMDTLRGFDVGKPLVIEEMFPLKAPMEDFEVFVNQSRDVADGWIGFYWGNTIEQHHARGTIGDHMTIQWLEFFEAKAPQFRRP